MNDVHVGVNMNVAVLSIVERLSFSGDSKCIKTDLNPCHCIERCISYYVTYYISRRVGFTVYIILYKFI